MFYFIIAVNINVGISISVSGSTITNSLSSLKRQGANYLFPVTYELVAHVG